jgi:hypothetical protein
VSVYASSSLTATVNTPSPPEDDPVTEGGPTRPIVQSNTETMQTTAVSTSLSLSRIDDLPIGSGTSERPVTEDQTEELRTTLHRAEEAIDTINTVNTWKTALNSIKWVMDTVGPIAAVCPILVFAYPS